ncbi:MAG: pilus assembly protein PilM [Patescibacteria group bacterium]
MSVFSNVTKLIPPPAYITMPSVGVDISDTSLKYVQFDVSAREKGYELNRWGDLDIPNGTLKRGEVKDKGKLTDVLKEVRSIISSPYVRVSLPEERAYLFETEIKRGIPFKEIRGLLEFRLEENVPISPRDAFFDYEIIDDSSERMVRVAVAAYSRDTIMNYYESCTKAGLVPVSFEVEAQAIARAALPENDPAAHIIVDFGKTRTGVGIVYRGTLMYTSTIDFGGNELSSVLRRELGDTPEAELTKIKNTQGLIKGVENTQVYDALISTVSVIKDELATRIQYWHTRDYKRSERRIQSVILCGGSANLKGLPEYLSETLGIRTVRANVWQNAFDINTTIPPIGRRYSFGYATAVGLALKNTV